MTKSPQGLSVRQPAKRALFREDIVKHLKSMAVAGAIAGSLMLGGAALAQDQKTYTFGVSVPTADHGWTGGVDYFAQQAVDRLGKAYPNL